MGKNPPANAEDTGETGLIPGSERSTGEGKGNPLQCSCLENPTHRGACWATFTGSQRGGLDLVTKQQGYEIKPGLC